MLGVPTFVSFVDDVDEPTCCIDDFGPLPLVRPRTIAEVGEVVRRAVADKQAIYPVGGRTLLGIGLPPTKPGLAVDLRGLAEVVDYPARDMTITVQAGITLARLQALLAAENQRLPLDIPDAENATLGGALAANISGPHRLGFGTARDYVIGISTINDDGMEVKAGGRVVKNVAGYDLCKLHVGALGTLGIISQVTLKLRPLPESKALVAFGCEGEALERLLNRLHDSATRPVCLDVVNRNAAVDLARSAAVRLPDAPWTILVGFEDNNDAVNWQIRKLLEELDPHEVEGLEAHAGAASDPLWQALVDFSLSGGRKPTERTLSGLTPTERTLTGLTPTERTLTGLTPTAQGLSFKANLLPSAAAAFCLQAAAMPEPMRLHAHAGSGIVYGHLDGDLTLPRASAMLNELTETAVQAQGNLVLPRCPIEWKRELSVWGRERGDSWLMRQVKDKMDPHCVFNPGRFAAGI